MSGKVFLSLDDVSRLASKAALRVVKAASAAAVSFYAIPRGGVPAAIAIAAAVERDKGFQVRFVTDPAHADYLVDDLIDSGETMSKAMAASEAAAVGLPTRARPLVLINKKDPSEKLKDAWIVFPWEGDAVGSFEDNVRRTLQFVGEDATRGGLLETPARVAKAWQFWCKGYAENPADILKTFEDGAQGCNEMVMVRDIPFYTNCEHHMAPFFGTATIAYIPDGRIVGLSKLSRLLDCFARRLQVQERLTTQVADALMDHLSPKGAGVILRARHLCMESRGVRQQGHSTVTSALRGVMVDGVVRQEFLQLAAS
jgi:GTP cyclohydrolase I